MQKGEKVEVIVMQWSLLARIDSSSQSFNALKSLITSMQYPEPRDACDALCGSMLINNDSLERSTRLVYHQEIVIKLASHQLMVILVQKKKPIKCISTIGLVIFFGSQNTMLQVSSLFLMSWLACITVTKTKLKL